MKSIKPVKLTNKNLIEDLEIAYNSFTTTLFGNKEEKIEPKTYKLILNEDSKQSLKGVILFGSWKGYQESTQLNFIYEFLKQKNCNIQSIEDLVNDEFDLTWNELNILYSYLKNISGIGIKNAKNYFSLLNDVSIPMELLLKDQQNHKDLALKLQAAENGISVEELNKKLSIL